MFEIIIFHGECGSGLGRVCREWALLLLRRVRTFDAVSLPDGWPCLLGHSAAAHRVLRNWQCLAADA